MTSHTYTNNGAGLERVRYFSRQLITADDMLAEQQYFRQKLRRHNRYLHGWGVVCGLKVVAAPDKAEEPKKMKWPWRVKVEAGYAIGPYGDEIYVAEPVCLDLATCLELVPDPCEPGEPPKPIPPRSGKIYVAIRYVECETRPVRVHPLGCACEDTLCEYSRIRDDFEIGCVPEPPEIETPLLCYLLGRKELAPCPPCPDSPWVVLAEVTLPEPANAASAPAEPMPALKDENIDNFVRRQLSSTTTLQEQLIECCCEPEQEIRAQLRVGKVAEQDGNSVNYTITVDNDGSVTADNVVVRDSVPQGVTVTGTSTPTQGQWTTNAPPMLEAHIDHLAPNQTVTLQYQARLTTAGKFTNTATASANNAGEVEASVTVELPGELPADPK